MIYDYTYIKFMFDLRLAVIARICFGSSWKVHQTSAGPLRATVRCLPWTIALRQQCVVKQ